MLYVFKAMYLLKYKSRETPIFKVLLLSFLTQIYLLLDIWVELEYVTELEEIRLQKSSSE